MKPGGKGAVAPPGDVYACPCCPDDSDPRRALVAAFVVGIAFQRLGGGNFEQMVCPKCAELVRDALSCVVSELACLQKESLQ